MKLTIHQGNDPILKSSCYSLNIGTRVYHYEKLADILYRVAVLFEPPPEEKKPRRKKTESTYDKMSREVMNNLDVKTQKKHKKFPLGNSILKVLNNIPGYVSVDSLMEQIKTPRPIRKQIWSTVLAKLVKRKTIKKVIEKGEPMYSGGTK